MRTLKEQYDAVIRARAHLGADIDEAKKKGIYGEMFMEELMERYDALGDAIETIKRVESLFNFIADTFKG